MVRNTFTKHLTFALVGLLSLLTVGAANSQSTPTAAPTERGLFWKVEKDGRTSYLFGTVHVWKREWLPLNPGIEKAFAGADRCTWSGREALSSS